MSTSGGGGYCDCGDVEAWQSEPFCDIHKRGLHVKDKNKVRFTAKCSLMFVKLDIYIAPFYVQLMVIKHSYLKDLIRYGIKCFLNFLRQIWLEFSCEDMLNVIL